MKKSIFKKNELLSIINRAIIDLPSPSTINSLWNFGSILGVILIAQIITGIFLSFHYNSDITTAFSSIISINYRINNGWFLRAAHANGASIFFLIIYFHTIRNIYYNSFFLSITWVSGITILLVSIITAFVGYVLPWGQISFWGATVITNLLSAIPYLGTTLVEWIWGGFSVDKPTLTRFFSFHFLFPFILLVLVILHLVFLHRTGSSNPSGINSNSDKIPFHPFFSSKDIVGFLFIFSTLLLISTLAPNLFTDPENFSMANPLVAPIHIQPEWYFLFAYTILRSVPNKLGGVLALIIAILILYFFPLINNNSWQGNQYSPEKKVIFWILINNIIILTWLGIKPVEFPFNFLSILISPLYFILIIIIPAFNFLRKK